MNASAVEAGRTIRASENVGTEVLLAEREHPPILIEGSAPWNDLLEREHPGFGSDQQPQRTSFGADPETTWISNSFARACLSQTAGSRRVVGYPLSTSTRLRSSAGDSKPLRSIHPSTRPDVGEIPRNEIVCHTFA